jgi:hypothetical protein
VTKLREQFKKDHPETIGETDSAFDNSNYIEWLEAELTAAQKTTNNSDYAKCSDAILELFGYLQGNVTKKGVQDILKHHFA